MQNTGQLNDIVMLGKGISVSFGAKQVLENLDIAIRRKQITAIIGPSGAGKSVLLRVLLGLATRSSGTIEAFGQDVEQLSDEQRSAIERRWGVMFQHGALFSSLSVLENIQVPMREHLNLSRSVMNDLAILKLSLTGLTPEVALRNPSELSGGMIKRVALARAIALDPEVLFLDEPVSGLDPIGAQEFDDLIARLRDTLGLTIVMVTHDLSSLFDVTDMIAVLGDRRVKYFETLENLITIDDDWLKAYFGGKRAKVVIRTRKGILQ